mmetsp:Transcript_3932/g.10913  ORF Transcript_3932/g.10913 Transcript_3932/m.10913 type:complete len:259 (-) Transcript_3932:901-1677(-)
MALPGAPQGAPIVATAGVLGKWHAVFEGDPQIRVQQVYRSSTYPDKIITDAIGSQDKAISDLFYVDSTWVIIVSTYHKRPFRQALRCRETWDEMAAELSKLGKECWRFSSITWGTGDWVAILTRPYKVSKPVCWFGGQFSRAKAFVVDRYSKGYYLDYVGYVHSEQEYFLSMTLNPEMAAKQKLFFTQKYPLETPDIIGVWRNFGLMQVTGGLDGWVASSSDKQEARDLVCVDNWPGLEIATNIERGLWVRCLRYVPA